MVPLFAEIGEVVKSIRGSSFLWQLLLSSCCASPGFIPDESCGELKSQMPTKFLGYLPNWPFFIFFPASATRVVASMLTYLITWYNWMYIIDSLTSSFGFQTIFHVLLWFFMVSHVFYEVAWRKRSGRACLLRSAAEMGEQSEQRAGHLDHLGHLDLTNPWSSGRLTHWD